MRLRFATLAGLLALACAVVGCGSTDPPPKPCGNATLDTYIATLGSAATRIYGQERHGGAVNQAISAVQHYGPLIRAVDRHDITGAQRAVLHLVYDHLHIVRLRIAAAHHVLVDIGGTRVLAPIHGALRAGKRVVGGFALSIQDDVGYELLARRFVSGDVVLRVGKRTILSSLQRPPAVLPSRGYVTYSGRRYGVYSYNAFAFPGGTLRISLMFAIGQLDFGNDSCAQVTADTMGLVVQHAYRQASLGPGTRSVLAFVRAYKPLRKALSTRSTPATQAAIQALINNGKVGRLRVSAGQQLLVDEGYPNMIAPVTSTFPGVKSARLIMAVQGAKGFSVLGHALTGGQVIVRSGTIQLASTLGPAPESIPVHGQITISGVRYGVSSFPAQEFPSGPMRVYTLMPIKS